MTVNKLTNPPTPQEQINKLNEIIDAIPTDTSVLSNGANFLVNNAAGSTNGVAVKGSGGIQSTQIGALGSAASMSTSVGFSAYATGSQAISIGHGAQATAAHSYSFGEQAKSTAKGAFQFGYGTNDEAGTVQFGLNTGDDNSDTVNYKLLGSDGLIPTARLNVVTSVSATSTDTQIPSAKLLYDSLETKVSKSGDTMTGRLQLNYPSVSDNPPIIIKSTNLDFDTTENTDIFPPLMEFVDENNNRMAQIEYIKYSDGSHYLSFSDKKNSTESLFSAFSLGWDSNGNKLCQLPRTEYPKILVASGIIANAGADSTVGAGTATVILHNSGLAEIHYTYQITTSGSNPQGWSWGLNRDLLVTKNSNIPDITPIDGGTLIIFRSDGVVDTGSVGYGGLNQAMVQFWQPARIYQTDGAKGGWSSNTFPVGYIVCGVAFGTYTVT